MISPSSVKRIEDRGAKTGKINSLLEEIVWKLQDLSGQGLLEVKAFLEAKIQEAKKSLRDTTKVLKKG